MTRFLPATLLSILFTWPVNAADNEEVIAFALSPDDAMTAVVVHEPEELIIRGEAVERRLALPRYAEAEAVARRLAPRLSWSADSRFLAVEYVVDDQTTAVEVIDVVNLSTVWTRAVAGAAWSSDGHDLLVVPAYLVGDWQTQPGLVRVNAESRKEDVVAVEHYFMGDIDVGHHVVVGHEVRLSDSLPVFTLTRVTFDEGD